MNTSTLTTTDAVERLLDSLPVPMLLVDPRGHLLHANPLAVEELSPAALQDSLLEMVADGDALARSLRLARSSSGATPAGVEVRETGKKLRATISPLLLQPGKSPQHLFISLQNRRYANHRLLTLRGRLDEAVEQRRVLAKHNQRLQKTIEKKLPQLKQQLLRDPLTGIHNRRYFDVRLQKEWHRAMRQQGELSLVYCDIDEFKRFNDNYGHQRGDDCLRRVAGALVAAIEREFDFAARIGGEEFAVVLPMTGAAGAIRVARRMLGAVRDLGIEHDEAAAGITTISCGVATARPEDDAGLRLLVDAADRAMYAAKRAGRNRLAVAVGEPATAAAS